MSDPFGVRGRAWLAEQPLPADERDTLLVCLRQIDVFDGEITALDRALARKLVVIAWHMPMRGEDDAFVQPSVVRQKLRRLEIQLGAERHRGERTGVSAERTQHRLEKELAAQAEAPTSDWSRTESRARPVREPQVGRASHDAKASTSTTGISPSPCASVRRVSRDSRTSSPADS